MRITESKLRRIIRSVINEEFHSMHPNNIDQGRDISGAQFANYVLSMQNMIEDIDGGYYRDYGFNMKGDTTYFGKMREPNGMAVVTDIVEKCFSRGLDEETCIRACNDEYTHGSGMYRIS